MNPVPLFLIIVSLPLLLGGCGEKGGAIKKMLLDAFGNDESTVN